MKYRFIAAVDLDFDNIKKGGDLYASFKNHVDLWAAAHPTHVKHVGHKDTARRGDNPIDMNKMKFRSN